MIRVLIVDDSSTSRMLLRHIVDSAIDMTVIAELTDGAQAVEQVKKLRPDVILMDIVMPEMDGMEATGEIMAQFPTPIVMISAAVQGRETEMAFQAIKKGALSLMAKPDGPDHPEYEDQARRLLSTLRAMAKVRVIHHRPQRAAKEVETAQPIPPFSDTLEAPPKIIGIVSSTGGPAALADLCQALPGDFPLPIVIVQHIAADFQRSLMSWIRSVTTLPVQMAEEGQTPPHGITFAPTGKHLRLDAKKRFVFSDTPTSVHTPSGDVLFSSMAHVYGPAAVGVILTGMGADGAAGLLEMRQRGALTIGQNQATSAVYGMPREAKQRGAVCYELGLNMIAPMLREIIEREPS